MSSQWWRYRKLGWLLIKLDVIHYAHMMRHLNTLPPEIR